MPCRRIIVPLRDAGTGQHAVVPGPRILPAERQFSGYVNRALNTCKWQHCGLQNGDRGKRLRLSQQTQGVMASKYQAGQENREVKPYLAALATNVVKQPKRDASRSEGKNGQPAD
jgi:hypothetical protein